MMSFLLPFAAAIMVVTALAHSVLGERRLITPLLASNHSLLSGYRSSLVRFAWHFTSVLMVLSAAVVIWPATPTPLVAVTGALWLFAGIFDAICTRFKHVGWPLLSLAGLITLFGAW